MKVHQPALVPTDHPGILNDVWQETWEVVKPGEILVAFSGDVDTTVVPEIKRQILPKERPVATTVDGGSYFPDLIRRQITEYISERKVSHVLVPGRAVIEEVARSGPAGNRCTRSAKLGTLRRHYGFQVLMVGGSNRSDRWGYRGLEIPAEYLFALIRPGKTANQPIGTHFEENGRSYRGTPGTRRMLFEALGRLEDRTRQCQIDRTATRKYLSDEPSSLPVPRPGSRVLEVTQGVQGVESAILVRGLVTQTVRANPGQDRNAATLYRLPGSRIQPRFAYPVRIRGLPLEQTSTPYLSGGGWHPYSTFSDSMNLSTDMRTTHDQ